MYNCGLNGVLNISPKSGVVNGQVDEPYKLEARHDNCIVMGIANDQFGDLHSNHEYEFVIRFEDGTEFRKVMSESDYATFTGYAW